MHGIRVLDFSQGLVRVQGVAGSLGFSGLQFWGCLARDGRSVHVSCLDFISNAIFRVLAIFGIGATSFRWVFWLSHWGWAGEAWFGGRIGVGGCERQFFAHF